MARITVGASYVLGVLLLLAAGRGNVQRMCGWALCGSYAPPATRRQRLALWAVEYVPGASHPNYGGMPAYTYGSGLAWHHLAGVAHPATY